MNRYRKLILSAIAFSATGSNIVLFSIGGIAATPMRLIGLVCILLVLVNAFNVHFIDSIRAAFIILLFDILCSTLLFSPDLKKSIPLVVDYFVCFSVMLIIIDNVATLDGFKQCLVCFYIVFLITSVICAYEYVTGYHIASNYTSGMIGDLYNYLNRAPTAFLFNPNNVGVFMIITLPLLFIIPDLFGENKKNLMIVLVITDMAIIFMTGSRGAFGGGVILIVLYALFSENKFWFKLMFVIVGLLIILLVEDYITIQLSYGGMIKNGTISVFHEGDGGRSILAKDAIDQVFKLHWLLGSGAGGIELITGKSVHNFWIEVLSNYGIVGFSLLLFCVIRLIRNTNNIREKSMRKGLLLLLLAILISTFIPPTIMTLHFLWVVLAFVITYRKIESKSVYK